MYRDLKYDTSKIMISVFVLVIAKITAKLSLLLNLFGLL